MPMYEFKCSACGHKFEKLEKRMVHAGPDASDVWQSCPKCGQRAKLQVLNTSFQLKGS